MKTTDSNINVSDLLQHEVSWFKSTVSKYPSCLTIREVLGMFSSSLFKEKILEAREYLNSGDEEMYKACKATLPVITFSGVFENGHSKSNLSKYNSIIVIDIDHLSESSYVEVKRNLILDDYVFALWTSPSGVGIKGLIVTNIANNSDIIDIEHKCAFRQISLYYKNKYSIDLDISGSDYSRLCFACWDENLIIKSNAKVFDVDLSEAETETKQKTKSKNAVETEFIANNKSNIKGRNKQQDKDTILRIIKFLRKKSLSITYEYDDWIRVAYAITDAFNPDLGHKYYQALSQQDPTKYDEKKCIKQLDYCYSHSTGQIKFSTIVYLAKKQGFKVLKSAY